MKALVILNGDSPSGLQADKREKLTHLLTRSGYETKTVELRKSEEIPCLGCLSCLKAYAGKWVSKDSVFIFPLHNYSLPESFLNRVKRYYEKKGGMIKEKQKPA